MQDLVWALSFVLAVVFLVAGAFRVFWYEQAYKQFPWIHGLPRRLVIIVGVAEILGALGLILPIATGIYPWLTTAAAAMLTLLMLMAAQFHVVRREHTDAAVNLLLMAMTAFVAYGRWPLLPTI